MDHQSEIEIEAQHRLPQEDEAVHNFRAESTGTGRRRKRALCIASIAVVLGIATGVGVAVSIKPRSQQTAALAQNAPKTLEPVKKIPITTQAFVEPGDDPTELLLEETDEPAAHEPVHDTKQVRDETDKPADKVDDVGHIDEEEENEEVDQLSQQHQVDIDDETQDVIIDAGNDSEPETYTFDNLREEEDGTQDTLDDVKPVPEKVEADSVEFPAVLSNFEGPLSDFIVTGELSRIKVSSINACDNANEGFVKLSITTDDYPWENRWELISPQGGIEAFGPPVNTNYSRRTRYLGNLCLDEGQWTLRLYDKTGDGICCDYGEGQVNVSVNGNKVVTTGDEDFYEANYLFKVTPSADNTPASTPTPTRRPTLQPIPILNPATACAAEGKFEVTIEVATDMFGGETGYSFGRGSNKLLNKEVGSLGNEQTYIDTLCVNKGKFTFTIKDDFRGLCCQDGQGYYSVKVDGEEVVYGASFFEPTVTHDILVGHQPSMSSRDREWLDAHNTRRKTFHENENTEYKELVWSTDLAEQAFDWVDVILQTCKISRDPGLSSGENMSSRSTLGPRITEGPDDILARWSDNKMNQSYPKNQSMTQVQWRGSRYVGCSDKMEIDANGEYCYVSVCRYARSGNCGMSQYNGDWKKGVLKERTQCGPSCAPEGCF